MILAVERLADLLFGQLVLFPTQEHALDVLVPADLAVFVGVGMSEVRAVLLNLALHAVQSQAKLVEQKAAKRVRNWIFGIL